MTELRYEPCLPERKTDDKTKTHIGIAISMLGELALFAIFSGGLLAPKTMWGTIPVATVLFGLFQGMWWGGCGILAPLAVG
jgi:hypothetical protein